MSMPNIAEECAKVDAWNAANKVGAGVSYRNDAGKATVTSTRSPAEMLGGHTAVIWLNDVRGCVALSRVTAVELAGEPGLEPGSSGFGDRRSST